MPNVNAPVRLMQSGEAITQFTDTASTTTTTFTYPNQQEGLSVTNKGTDVITLTVNSANYTIQPGQAQAVAAVFSSFVIKSANGTQQFEATAWSYANDEVDVSDSKVHENPYNTTVGQIVVSEEENFWARKLREGRTAFKLWDAVNLPTPGTGTQLTNFNPRVDKVFIPALFTFGSDTDCILKVQYFPYKDFAPYDTAYATQEYLINTVIAAKTPFIFRFNGELEIAYGGNIIIWVTPMTAAGKAYANLHGIEVSKRA